MSLFKTNLTGVPSLTSPLPRFYFFGLLFSSHRSPLSERLEQASCATVNSASDTAAEMEFVSAANTSAERVSCGVARAAFEGSCNWTG